MTELTLPVPEKTKKFTDEYTELDSDIIQKEGAKGKVMKVKRDCDGKIYAVKRICKLLK